MQNLVFAVVLTQDVPTINAVRRAHARAEFWAERAKMMHWWADRLDELTQGGE